MWPLNKVLQHLLQALLRSCDFKSLDLCCVLAHLMGFTAITKQLLYFSLVVLENSQHQIDPCFVELITEKHFIITVIHLYIYFCIFFFVNVNVPAIINCKKCHIKQKCTLLFKKFVVNMIHFKELIQQTQNVLLTLVFGSRLVIFWEPKIDSWGIFIQQGCINQKYNEAKTNTAFFEPSVFIKNYNIMISIEM